MTPRVEGFETMLRGSVKRELRAFMRFFLAFTVDRRSGEQSGDQQL
jgi:hypothetical protein